MRREMLDERLDALLDEALRLPEPPAGLTERVLAATVTRLPAGRAAGSAARDRAVLARVGPSLLSLAATVALAAGAALWVASAEAPPPTAPIGVVSVAAGETPLAIDRPWDASIDNAITVLGLQVEMVDLRWDDTWAEPSEGVQDAVLRWELEAMRGDGMVF